MSTNCVVLSNDRHPLIKSVRWKGPVVNITQSLDIPPNTSIIIDLTVMETAKKKALIDQIIKKNSRCHLYLDTTINHAAPLWNNDQVKGVFSAAFWSPKNAGEIYYKSDHTKIEKSIQSGNFQFIESTFPEILFTYPRMLSLIINDTFRYIEEDHASPQDIDLAMIYGLNYPLGPIEWSHKIGHHLIVQSLRQMQELTCDNRYAPVSSLLTSQKEHL